MAEAITIDVESRDSAVKAKDIRSAGKIPAIMYAKGKENISLQMDYQNFRRAFRKAGESTVIEVKVDGKNTENVLVHDYQLHPVTDNFLHVDFLAVDMKKEITADIHLEFVGESPAVKNLGAQLAVGLQTVQVKCLPANLPHHIEVDVTGMEVIGAQVHVGDLTMPEGVELLTDPEMNIVSVSAAKQASEEEEASASAEGEAAEGDKSEEAAA